MLLSEGLYLAVKVKIAIDEEHVHKRTSFHFIILHKNKCCPIDYENIIWLTFRNFDKYFRPKCLFTKI